MFKKLCLILSASLILINLSFPQVETNRFVAITFDDLPMNTKYLQDGKQWIEQTQKILNTIKKYNIPAIGFVNEYKLYVNDLLDSSR